MRGGVGGDQGEKRTLNEPTVDTGEPCFQPVNPVADGQPCQVGNSCQKGSLCINVDQDPNPADFRCYKACSNAAPGCPSGTRCKVISGPTGYCGP